MSESTSAQLGGQYERAKRHYQAGELLEAEQLARQILAQDSSHAGAAHLLAVLGLQTGHADEALQLLLLAVRTDPGFIEAWLTLGLTYRRAGKVANAAKAFEHILDIDPGHVVAHYLLGLLRSRAGQSELAMQHFNEVLAREPAHADALAGIAELHERHGRLEEARTAAEGALAASADQVVAALTLAQVDIRTGRLPEAVTRLEALSERELSPRNRSIALGQLSAAYDKLGRFDDAWNCAQQSNEVLLKLYAHPLPDDGNVYSLASVDRLQRFLAGADPGTWRACTPPPEARRPVFLVGFPRSGTTLLDQILSSHPQLYAVEEQETLRDIYLDHAGSDAALARLPDLTAEQIARYREQYWQRLDALVPAEMRGRTIIDKLPLNSLLLGPIQRFFPDARILFALRDPRDVCLSCFLQTFVIEGAMGYFLTLEGTAGYYRNVMNLALEALDKLPLAAQRIRYEDLVHHFDDQAGALLEFLGVPWSEDVRGFHELAGRRAISTPSYRQVAQPLYEGSIGRWRSYRRPLAPILDVLRPFVERLGYPPD